MLVDFADEKHGVPIGPRVITTFFPSASIFSYGVDYNSSSVIEI